MTRRKHAIPLAEDRPTVTVEEAAEWLGLSRASGYRAARAGEIPSITIGRRIVVPTAELRRFLCLDEPPAPARATTPAATTPVSVMAASASPRPLSPPAPRRRRDVSTAADRNARKRVAEPVGAAARTRRAPARPAQS